VLRHTGTDFLDMGRFMLLGCMASAFLKTVAPVQVLLPFKNNVLLSLAVMMGLAIDLLRGGRLRCLFVRILPAHRPAGFRWHWQAFRYMFSKQLGFPHIQSWPARSDILGDRRRGTLS
jgi:hypothetical protein